MAQRYVFFGIFVFLMLASAFGVYAHGGEGDIDAALRDASIWLAWRAGIILFVLVIITLAVKEPTPPVKKLLFSLMVIAIVIPTIFFAVTTVYINNISETGGPVHWHADFQIFACGKELLPPEAPRFSNKAGTAVFHEHGDRRIHVEGVLVSKEGASLGEFFEVEGGALSETAFSVPTKEGIVTYTNGDRCPDGDAGMWQVFLYTTKDGVATQKELRPYRDYVLSPETLVPPGDCLIFEFGEPKDRTDHVCNFYRIEQGKGKLMIQ